MSPRAVLILALVACGCGGQSRATTPVPPHPPIEHERPRLLTQEPYLRAYLAWFGGLTPLDVQNKARPKGLFDTWDDYLAALGLPELRLDLPRAAQSNALMVATLGRLGEALCTRAAERDLGGKTELDKRVVFNFEPKPSPTRDEFAERLDVLHRLFLSYPLALAPSTRVERFYVLYRQVAAHSDDTHAWAAVCTALVQHPEASLY